MPEFDKNAAFLWTLIALGLAVPFLLTAFAVIRVKLAKARLQRLQDQED